MCGISGIFAFTDKGKELLGNIDKANSCLSHRGPDAGNTLALPNIALGHRRLSIIDLSDNGSQPMSDPNGRYHLIFNGEFYNYQAWKDELLKEGVQFQGSSDTEVLLHLLIRKGEQALHHINGFFSLAFYDVAENYLLIARDRYGVKPLVYAGNEDYLIFASEIKALQEVISKVTPDPASVHEFFHLNYIPGPDTIFQEVKKLPPGNLLESRSGTYKISRWYELPGILSKPIEKNPKEVVRNLLTEAVKLRLIADVPVGCFLSGGLDSSIIAILAAKENPGLQTFSVGFTQNPHFDETRYAEMVSKQAGTTHHCLKLTNDDLFHGMEKVLDHIDQPFADASCIPFFLLSQYASEHVKVCLSGDGADELFGGYQKHQAEIFFQESTFRKNLLQLFQPFLRHMPGSRENILQNRIRQAKRFTTAMKMDDSERYWNWAGVEDEASMFKLLKFPEGKEEYLQRKKKILHKFNEQISPIDKVLQTDLSFILPDDMLVKVDLMSMANGLEVRNPFMDFHVVEAALSIPYKLKIKKGEGKFILREAFRKDLPSEILRRPKKGFEVPLLAWFRGPMKDRILNQYLGNDMIHNQGIFDPSAIAGLKKQLFSANPGEIQARIWGLIVFQHWWMKNQSYA